MMMRMIAGAFAALLLVASPALAQDVASDLNTQAQADGVDFASTSEAEIDNALNAGLQGTLVANSGVPGATEIADLTDEQLAGALGGILENNPGLTAAQVTALVRAAVRARPEYAVQIAAAAAYARPDVAREIQQAAVSVAPADLAASIVSATVVAAQTATNDGRGENNLDEASAG